CPCSDHSGPAHVNGVFPLRNNLQWALEFWQRRQPRSKQKPIDYEQLLRHLPVSEMPSLVDQDAVPYWRDWLKPDTWKILDFAQYAPLLTVPALLHTGWYDVSQASTLAIFTALKNHSNARVREETRLLIGPWSHSATVAPGSLPAETPLPDRKKYLDPIRREYLLAKLTGATSAAHPAVTYYMYGANEWRTAPSWPPPETRQIPLFLHSDGLANSSRGHGALSPDPPEGRELPDTCIYDPGNPVPSCGGRAAIEGGGPQLQNDTEFCTDVLCYTTEPLTTPLELAGEVTLVLYAATSTPDTDYAVKLVDVHPDGSAWDLADGVMRASYHDQQTGQPASPGQIRELHVSLWSIACRLPSGHRLRLTVTFSDFPAYVRNLNTGAKDETGREYLLSRQDIFHDSRHPSHLLLPIR
ncbi:MAG: CocE/NonD family hydrolase, partial [Victivallales bacterium]|nr:CocE/NonD family hydrolase [Victivallales bacterium]